MTQLYGSCLCPREIIYTWNNLSQMWKFRFSCWLSRTVTYFSLGTLAICFLVKLNSDTWTQWVIKYIVVTFSVVYQAQRWWMDKTPTERNLLYKHFTKYLKRGKAIIMYIIRCSDQHGSVNIALELLRKRYVNRVSSLWTEDILQLEGVIH